MRVGCIGVLAALTLLGCPGAAQSHRVMTVRTGAVYMAKPAPCEVRFENLSFLEAQAKYEQIGLITVTDMPSSALTEDVKRDVEREACGIGADALTFNAGTGNMLQFLAWHSKK